jgi:TonB dependent receptor
VIGASVDHSSTDFDSGAQLGAFDSSRFLVPTDLFVTSGENLTNVSVNESNTYSGVYLTDTFDITPTLFATASARYNRASLTLIDQLGGDLSGSHPYQHFNPAFGLTYKVTPAVTAYADYAQSNRIPSAAELSCASPTASCSLASFFVADPNLQQVVAQTYEAGLRSGHGAALQWNLSVFRTAISNDIIEEARSTVSNDCVRSPDSAAAMCSNLLKTSMRSSIPSIAVCAASLSAAIVISRLSRYASSRSSRGCNWMGVEPRATRKVRVSRLRSATCSRAVSYIEFARRSKASTRASSSEKANGLEM